MRSLEQLCAILDWDTQFFGFRIARFFGDTLTHELVTEIDDWCQHHGVRCLYFLARADDPNTTILAEDCGYRFVDVRITFQYQVAGELPEHKILGLSSARIRDAKPEDVDSLAAIARASFHDTRFYFDPNFPSDIADSLYETWIRNSCADYADAVLVADQEGEPVGLITCHRKDNADRGMIGLVGVHPSQRGMGLGKYLIQEAVAWFLSNGVDTVQVVTQGRNVAAHRLYQRSGFLTQNVQLWYHKWY